MMKTASIDEIEFLVTIGSLRESVLSRAQRFPEIAQLEVMEGK